MADTRQYDLMELWKAHRESPSLYWRDILEQKIHRIMAESGAVSETREKLIMAIRNDDRWAIQKFQHELEQMQYK